MGQYTQQGGITCWRRLCPLAEGESKDLNKLMIFFYLHSLLGYRQPPFAFSETVHQLRQCSSE